jgi:hypothetical protein
MRLSICAKSIVAEFGGKRERQKHGSHDRDRYCEGSRSVTNFCTALPVTHSGASCLRQRGRSNEDIKWVAEAG